ncbi:MAG: capsular biosynthesis protein [Tenericutes bacterium HGW-Tenericutes-2]|nr:MAG: capsular biosynthesis protein [Tenericutes bacterium HGW-Tenericutes-2]
MPKICILSTVNLIHMTLISLYTDFLEINNIEYDIIHIDKYGQFEDNNANRIYPYRIVIDSNWTKLKKLRKYYGFKKYAINLILNNKYEYIVVWNSYTAILFSSFLSKKYKQKFVLNIRDYSLEKFLPVYLIMKKVIKNSFFTTVSSNGFKRFLPRHNYIFVNSMNASLLKNIEKRNEKRDDFKPIRISFIGYVRFYENDIKLINLLGNDARFVIQYFGQGSDKLQKYCEENGIKNVNFHGRFDKSQTLNFLEQTDIINNLYGSGKIELDTAISIKFYYSISYQIPILVDSNTYMEDLIKKYDVGLSIDWNIDNLSDCIFDWYRNLNYQKYIENCEMLCKKIEEENLEFQDQFKTFLVTDD